MTASEDEARRLLHLAARDYRTFSILRDHSEAELSPTCFHAQQAVEKALKAVLTVRGTDYRRIHDLEELANLLADGGISTPIPAREYRRLNPFAVEFRYEDEPTGFMTKAEADAMVTQTLKWAEQLVAAGAASLLDR